MAQKRRKISNQIDVIRYFIEKMEIEMIDALLDNNKTLEGVVHISDYNLRRTAHTHHPVDDAKGNAEAMLAMKYEFGLRF